MTRSRGAVGVPAITDAVLREARQRPGGWVCAVDPMFRPEDATPGPPQGGLFLTEGPSGKVLQVFTDPADVRATGWPDVATVEAGQLMNVLPQGGDLVVNPGIEPTLRWSQEDLLRISAAADGPGS